MPVRASPRCFLPRCPGPRTGQGAARSEQVPRTHSSMTTTLAPQSTSTPTDDLTLALNAYADAMADALAYADMLDDIAADVAHQTSERARQTESAWDRAFHEGWAWDVLADF